MLKTEAHHFQLVLDGFLHPDHTLPEHHVRITDPFLDMAADISTNDFQLFGPHFSQGNSHIAGSFPSGITPLTQRNRDSLEL